MNRYQLSRLEKKRHPGNIFDEPLISRRGKELFCFDTFRFGDLSFFPLEVVQVMIPQQANAVERFNDLEDPFRIGTFVDEVTQEDQLVTAAGRDMVQQRG